MESRRNGGDGVKMEKSRMGRSRSGEESGDRVNEHKSIVRFGWEAKR